MEALVGFKVSDLGVPLLTLMIILFFDHVIIRKEEQKIVKALLYIFLLMFAGVMLYLYTKHRLSGRI